MSSRVPDQKHVFKESRRSGLASLGDRLRNSRTGKTRAAWLDCAVQKGPNTVCGKVNLYIEHAVAKPFYKSSEISPMCCV